MVPSSADIVLQNCRIGQSETSTINICDVVNIIALQRAWVSGFCVLVLPVDANTPHQGLNAPLTNDLIDEVRPQPYLYNLRHNNNDVLPRSIEMFECVTISCSQYFFPIS